MAQNNKILGVSIVVPVPQDINFQCLLCKSCPPGFKWVHLEFLPQPMLGLLHRVWCNIQESSDFFGRQTRLEHDTKSQVVLC